MINSQLPYNQLLRLQDLNLNNDSSILDACEDCRRVLFHLNGYLDALSENESKPFLDLMQIVDCKYSFDLEEAPLAFNRLFEAYASENRLGDTTAREIFNSLGWFKQLSFPTVQSMEPSFGLSVRRSGDQMRDKKEIRIKSYFTNLSLYTAPVQSISLRALKEDLDSVLEKHLAVDELFHMAVCHFQFRALSPYVRMNGHVARSYSKLFLREMGLKYDVLPLSGVLFVQKERYNTLMREVVVTGAYKSWTLFLLAVIRESAEQMLVKLKTYMAMRRKVEDRISKYTEYHLPVKGLNHLIFLQPYIKPAMITGAFNCHRHTAYTYLDHLVKMGLLIEKSSGREKLYLHKELLDLLSE